VTAGWANGDSAGTTPDASTNHNIVSNTTAEFLVTCNLTLKTAGAINNTYRAEIFKAGSAIGSPSATVKLDLTTDVATISLSELVSITSGQSIDVRITCTTVSSTSVVVSDASLVIVAATGGLGATGATGAAGTFGGTLTQNLDAGQFAFYDFDNGHNGSWTSLGADGSTSTLAVAIKTAGFTLTASHKFVASLGCRVFMYLNSDHTKAGYMDITTMVNIVTDGSSVCTCIFLNTIIPDLSQLPSNLAGATCTVAASTGGFTISASRPAGVAASVWAHWFINNFQDTT
jgi:hypothetical protein